MAFIDVFHDLGSDLPRQIRADVSDGRRRPEPGGASQSGSKFRIGQNGQTLCFFAREAAGTQRPARPKNRRSGPSGREWGGGMS